MSTHTHVYAQGHNVAGSGWAVFCVMTVLWASGKNTPQSLTDFYMELVIYAVAGEHKHVCSKAMLMMLLQLPGFGSGAAAAVVVAVGCGF